MAKSKARVDQTIENTRQEVLKHYAKTVYFNNLWMDLLRKFGYACAAMSGYLCTRSLKRNNAGDEPISTSIFEALSILISLLGLFFAARTNSSTQAFRVGLVLCLMQCVWFSSVIYERNINRNQMEELAEDQLPIGSIYFLTLWCCDRYMAWSASGAKTTAKLATGKVE